MAFGQLGQQPIPQQQQQPQQAMNRVAQSGAGILGRIRPPGMPMKPKFSGMVRPSGPNPARMDLANGTPLQNYGGGPVGAPPPPNPGIGPSAPAENQMLGSLGGGWQNLAQGGANAFSGGPPPDMPRSPMPEIPNGGDPTGGMGNPQMDRMNAIKSFMQNMQQQGSPMGANPMQRPDVMPRGPMNTGPMIGGPRMAGPGMVGSSGSNDPNNQTLGMIRPQMGQMGMGMGQGMGGGAALDAMNQRRKMMMMGRGGGGGGIGPSWGQPSQQDQQANQDQPMKQAQPWNVG